jgi:hypothetical protein
MANQLTSEVAITCYIGRLPQYGGPTEEDLRLHALALGVVTEPWNKYRVRADIQRVCREEGRSLTVPPSSMESGLSRGSPQPKRVRQQLVGGETDSNTVTSVPVVTGQSRTVIDFCRHLETVANVACWMQIMVKVERGKKIPVRDCSAEHVLDQCSTFPTIHPCC